MSIRTGRRKDDSKFKYPIQTSIEEYQPKDLVIKKIFARTERGEDMVPVSVADMEAQRSIETRLNRNYEDYWKNWYLERDSNWKQPNQIDDIPENIWQHISLIERVDPEENPFRYIDVTYLDCPTLDSMREDRKFFEEKKGVKYKIELMTTNRYFNESARVHGHFSSAKERGNVSEKRSGEYAELMKSGVKFPLPYVDFDYGNQEGRNRVRALELLGVKIVPVMVVEAIEQ